MTKQTDVTFARGVVVIFGLGLGAAVPIIAEQHRIAVVWEVIAWAVIALTAMTLWHYREVRRRPVLFYSFIGMVIIFAIIAALAYVMPDCGPC